MYAPFQFLVQEDLDIWEVLLVHQEIVRAQPLKADQVRAVVSNGFSIQGGSLLPGIYAGYVKRYNLELRPCCSSLPSPVAWFIIMPRMLMKCQVFDVLILTQSTSILLPLDIFSLLI